METEDHIILLDSIQYEPLQIYTHYSEEGIVIVKQSNPFFSVR